MNYSIEELIKEKERLEILECSETDPEIKQKLYYKIKDIVFSINKLESLKCDNVVVITKDQLINAFNEWDQHMKEHPEEYEG